MLLACPAVPFSPSLSLNPSQAAQECEALNYIPELVYLYSKTGQTKRALSLIIDRLADVSRAIAFAKDQDDPDLWEDLLTYSMDKPRFIRALLEEVGTAINPITLVRRIPEGLEIEGLREGLKHIMKEHEIQFSICEGVARVLRSEVAAAQGLLRNGQRRGVKFAVATREDAPKDSQPPAAAAAAAAVDNNPPPNGDAPASEPTPKKKAKKYSPGHCAHCLEPFTEYEVDTLVGFACGHVFHLPHLLERLHPGEEERAADRAVLRGGAAAAGRHLVGAKVMHARALRERVTGGCVVCAAVGEEGG